MINHEPLPAVWWPNLLENQCERALTASLWLGHGETMNGFLAICSICREIIS
jgi:hypothetical protein